MISLEGVEKICCDDAQSPLVVHVYYCNGGRGGEASGSGGLAAGGGARSRAPIVLAVDSADDVPAWVDSLQRAAGIHSSRSAEEEDAYAIRGLKDCSPAGVYMAGLTSA